FTNVYNLAFNSSKNGASLGGTPQNVTLTVTGVIVVPEPGGVLLALLGAAGAAWLSRQRRA
ncbi:MAG: PEP-CTERM sorting domain-containing protein, partial [Planctomycetia bacterium]|nr:PEP-CTERM sorting domain-containing protein [Planctomycetia bacterium]